MKKLSFLIAGAVLAAVSVSASDTPLTLIGWNRDVIVENNASSPYTSAAQPFDVPNNYGFYEAGLPNGTRGLPISRTFTSIVDGSTVFAFQPYNQNNVLQLSASTSSSGILALTTPGFYSSISILAAGANSGASQGSMVIYFADLTTSPVLSF